MAVMVPATALLSASLGHNKKRTTILMYAGFKTVHQKIIILLRKKYCPTENNSWK
jgi:hypothetical protein